MSSNKNWWSRDLLQLREELRSKGLDINGSKPVLVRRLEMYEDSYKKRIEALKAKSKPVASEGSPTKPASSSPNVSKTTEQAAKPENVKPVPTPVEQNTSNTKPEENGDSGVPTIPEPEKAKDWWTMSMQELKNECSKRDLSFMGNKYTLVNRLRTFNEQNPKKETSTTTSSTPAKTTTSSTPAKTTTSSTPAKTTTGVAKPTTTNVTITKKVESSAPKSSTTPKDSAVSNTAKYEKLTFAQLKIECVNKKLEIAGSKQDLVSRLMKFQEGSSPSADNGNLSSTASFTKTIPQQSTTPKASGVAGQGPKPLMSTTPSPKPSGVASQASKPFISITPSPKQSGVTSQTSKLFMSTTPSPKPPGVASQVSKPPVSTVTTTSPALKSQLNFGKPTESNPNRQGSTGWSPVAQRTGIASQQTPTPQPPKKVLTFVKSIQTMAAPKRHMSSQTTNAVEVEKIQPVKKFYTDEQVEIAKKFSTKLPQWDDMNQLPDLTVIYDQAKSTDVKSKTVVAYPVSFSELQDPKFKVIQQMVQDLIIRFDDSKSLNKSIKGSVEMKFFTRRAAQDAVNLLKTWRRDLKVEHLNGRTELDDGLKKVGAKINKLEPLVNRVLFLNKLPMKLKEGDLAEKFSDAASITIVRDSMNVSKGYGFAEYNSRSDAQIAANRTKMLMLEGIRIDVKLYPKVPSDLTDEKTKLAMPDHERIKLAEQLHRVTLDLNKSKSGPYNRDRTEEQKLFKEISVLEEKLSVDAAIRKKLNYFSLPEPAAYLTPDLRRAWQTGDFSKSNVDIGKIHKSWEEPKFKDVKKDGPPPPKQTKMDSGNVQSGLAATLNQLKSYPSISDDRKRKDPMPQEQESSWNQRNQQQKPNLNTQSSWNRQGDQNRGWGDSQQKKNTWEQQKPGSTFNQQQKSYGSAQPHGGKGNVPSLFESTGMKSGFGGNRIPGSDTPFNRKDTGSSFTSSFGKGASQDTGSDLPTSFGNKRESDIGVPTSLGKRKQDIDYGLPKAFGKGGLDNMSDFGLPMAFGKSSGSKSSFGSGFGDDDDEENLAFGTGRSQIGQAMLEASSNRGRGSTRGQRGRGGFGRGGEMNRQSFQQKSHFNSQDMRGGFKEEKQTFGESDDYLKQRSSLSDTFLQRKQQQGGTGGNVPGLFDTPMNAPSLMKKKPSQEIYNKFYDGEDIDDEEPQLSSFAGRDQSSGRSMRTQDDIGTTGRERGWGGMKDDTDTFPTSLANNRSNMRSNFGQSSSITSSRLGGFDEQRSGRFNDDIDDDKDTNFGRQNMGRGGMRGGLLGRGGTSAKLGMYGSRQQSHPSQRMDDDMDIEEEDLDAQRGRNMDSFRRGSMGQMGGGVDESFYDEVSQGQFRRTPGARDSYGQDNYGDGTSKNQFNQGNTRGFTGRKNIDQNVDEPPLSGMGGTNFSRQDMGNQAMRSQGMRGQDMAGQGFGNQGMRGMNKQGMDNQGMNKPMGNQGTTGQRMNRPGMDNRNTPYGQQQRDASPSKTNIGSMGYGQQQQQKDNSTMSAGTSGKEAENTTKKPGSQMQQSDPMGYGYGQPNPYGQYDQAAYDAYYGQDPNQQYDYSQYDYSQYDYSQYGQYDYATGQWSHPYGDAKVDYSQQSTAQGGRQQPNPPLPTSQYSGSNQQSQAPPTSTSGAGDATKTEGEEDTVNVELVKKLSGAVTTLRQQMGYVADQQTTQDQTATSTSMPAFVSNMAYGQRNNLPLYRNLQQGGY